LGASGKLVRKKKTKKKTIILNKFYYSRFQEKNINPNLDYRSFQEKKNINHRTLKILSMGRFSSTARQD
jgi:hypothetical protein